MSKTLLIVLLTIFSQFLGFFRETSIAFYYGSSNQSDMIFISMLLPSLVIGVFASALNASFIPVLSEVSEREDEVVKGAFVLFTVSMVSLLSFFIFIIFLFFKKEFLILFVGYENFEIDEVIRLLQWTFCSVFFQLLTILLNGLMYFNGKNIGVILGGIFLNLFLILSVWISNDKGLEYFSIGYLFSYFFQALFVLCLSFRYFRYECDFYRYFYLCKRYINKLISISFPVLILVFLNQFYVMYDRSLALDAGNGGISALNYSLRIFGLVEGALVLSLMSINFPVISKLYSRNIFYHSGVYLQKVINFFSFITIPFAIFFVIYSHDIVEVLFGYGRFGFEAIKSTGDLLRYYSFGIVFSALYIVVLKFFYAAQNKKIPFIVGLFGVCINFFMDWWLFEFFGLVGLAIATSISWFLMFMCLIIFFKRMVEKIELSIIFLFLLISTINFLISVNLSKYLIFHFMPTFDRLSVIMLSSIFILSLVFYLINFKIFNFLLRKDFLFGLTWKVIYTYE